MDTVRYDSIGFISVLEENEHYQEGRCKYQGRFSCNLRNYRTANMKADEVQKLITEQEEMIRKVPSHASLIAFLGLTLDPDYNIICLNELLLGETLHSYLEKTNGMDMNAWLFRAKLVYTLSDAINFLHKHDIVIRNLNTSTVYLDHDYDFAVRLSLLEDFDVLDAIDAHKGKVRSINELYWKAPEFNSVKYGSGSKHGDLYSLGLIMWDLAFSDQYTLPLKKRPDINKLPTRPFIADNYIELMLNLLSDDPNKRPSAEEVAAELKQYNDKYDENNKSRDSTEDDTHLYTTATKDSQPSYIYTPAELESMQNRALQLYGNRDYVEAAKLFDIPAWNGYSVSQYHLAKMHLSGKGRSTNGTLALGWLERASNSGLPEAELLLAMMYLFKLGSNYSDSSHQSLPILKRLSNEEDRHAMVFLAYCYESGTNTSRDVIAARRLYDQLMLKHQDTMSFYRGAMMWENDTLGIADVEKAVELYKRGSEFGHVYCQFRLAQCYHFGRGVEVDTAKSMEYYTLAAQQNHPASLCVVAQRMLKGHGYKNPEPVMAAHYLELAAERGSMKAQQTLGHLYEKGNGVQVNFDKAAHWYTLAAKAGDPYSQNNLGRYFQNGTGVIQDFAKACKLYKQSAEAGVVQAMVNYARCLEQGLGVPANSDEAFKYYARASERDSPHAQFKLAHCYLRGVGTAVDLLKARNLYQASAKAGYHRAIDKLKQLGWANPNPVQKVQN